MRDAALRGLSVALFQRRDFGAGTTAGSTRLIHGGRRYPEMLDFRLVRLSRPQGVGDAPQNRVAPRLTPQVRRPLLRAWRAAPRRAKLRLGMALYDLLSLGKSLPRHHLLDASAARAAEPCLRHGGLQGAAVYYDAQAFSPERLCLENLDDAREHGARVFNYAEGTTASRSGPVVRGVRVRDALYPGARRWRCRAAWWSTPRALGSTAWRAP